MKFRAILFRITQVYINLPKVVRIFILSIPVLVFVLPILLSGNGVMPGDYDMQVQMTEAARRSIAEHHQFPLWNPWVAGGVPLFADPQFGLFTPQTLLSFIVGASYAWKLTLAGYFFVGFFSMRALLRNLTSKNEFVSVILSYIWVFGSFFALRSTGHFTFMLLALLPLAILLALGMGSSRKKRFYLMLLFAFSLNAAMHYSSILMLIAVTGVLLLDLSFKILTKYIESERSLTLSREFALEETFKLTKNLGFVCVGALLINLPKIYLGGKYLASNSVDRSGFYEPFIGLWSGLKAIALPFDSAQHKNLPFGLFEASSYIGTLTFVLAILLTTYYLTTRVRARNYIDVIKSKVPALLAFAAGTFVLGLGGYLFAGLRLLPIFSSMRVSTRWFFLTSFAVILILAIVADKIRQDSLSKLKFKVLLYPLLLLSFVQVYLVGFNLQRDNWTKTSMVNAYSETDKNTNKEVDSERFWEVDVDRHYYALTQATVNNKSQLVADNALVDTTIFGTIRCDQDESSCNYVLTNNADVLYWSPNQIILRRTAPGSIELNINPGSNWMVNGRSIYSKKTVSSSDKFIIEDSSQDLVISYSIF